MEHSNETKESRKKFEKIFWSVARSVFCFHISKLHLKYFLLCFLFCVYFIQIFLIVFHVLTQDSSHFPQLSETGVEIPGRYFFSTSLVIVGTCLSIFSLIMYSSQKVTIQKINSKSGKVLKCFFCLNLFILNFFSWLFAFVAGLGLICLAAVPIFEWIKYPDLSFTLIQMFHLSSSGVFFLSMVVHMIIQTVVCFGYNKRYWIWNYFKLGCVFLTLFFWIGVPLIYFLFIYSLCSPETLSTIQLQTYEKGSCAVYDVCEGWLGGVQQYFLILSLIVYGITYFYECSFVEIELNFHHNPSLTYFKKKSEDGRGGRAEKREEDDEDDENLLDSIIPTPIISPFSSPLEQGNNDNDSEFMNNDPFIAASMSISSIGSHKSMSLEEFTKSMSVKSVNKRKKKNKKKGKSKKKNKKGKKEEVEFTIIDDEEYEKSGKNQIN